MSDKITLASIGSFQNDTSAAAAYNSNNALLTTALDNTLSRDGTSPNQMLSNLDMNNNQILNLPAPATVNSPARLVDVVTNPTITVPPTGTSGGVVPFLNGNNTWSGTNAFTSITTSGNTTVSGNLAITGTSAFTGAITSGTGTYASPVDVGSLVLTNSLFKAIAGSSGSPISTDPPSPNIVSQLWSSTADGNTVTTPILGAFMKTSTNSVAWGTGVIGIGQDNVGGGGSFVEGVRGAARVNAGTNGSAYGLEGQAVTTASIAYKYLIAVEGTSNNNSGVDAPAYASFSSTPSTIGASFIASNHGTNKLDSAYLINPYNSGVYRSGFAVGAGSIDASGAAFVNYASLGNGLDLSLGTYATNQIKGTGFTIDNSNTLRTNGIIQLAQTLSMPAGGTTGDGLQMSSTVNFGIFFGSGAPTLSAAQGSIYLRSDGSSTSTRLYVNTTGSTTWTNVTTGA